MRPITPAVMSSLMALTTPPTKGQVEYEGEKVLVKTHDKGATIAEFDLAKLCHLVNSYCSSADQKVVDPQQAFRDAPPIAGNSNIRRNR